MRNCRKRIIRNKAQEEGKEEEVKVFNVASTHTGHFATQTEGRTVEKEL
jgi:hypothetical protein